MTTPLTPEQQQALNELRNGIIADLDRGLSEQDVVNRLVREGWAEADAAAAVVRVASERPDPGAAFAELQHVAADAARNEPPPPPPEVMEAQAREAARRTVLRRMCIGAVVAIVGTVITVGTFLAAQEGGSYFIAYGAIIYGVIDFFRGLIGYFATD